MKSFFFGVTLSSHSLHEFAIKYDTILNDLVKNTFAQLHSLLVHSTRPLVHSFFLCSPLFFF